MVLLKIATDEGEYCQLNCNGFSISAESVEIIVGKRCRTLKYLDEGCRWIFLEVSNGNISLPHDHCEERIYRLHAPPDDLLAPSSGSVNHQGSATERK